MVLPLRRACTLLLSLGLSALLCACGEGTPRRLKDFDKSKDATPKTDGGDDGGDGSEGTDGTSDVGADGATDGGDAGNDIVTLSERWSHCGLNPDQPEASLLNTNLIGLPAVLRGTERVVILPVTYTATIVPSLGIVGAIARTAVTMGAKVTVNPETVQKVGDAFAKKLSGAITYETMVLAQRAALDASNPLWANVDCTVSATTKATAQSGTGVSIATFAPAVPTSIWPLANVETLNEELAVPRVFAGIVATVVQSADPAYPVGSTHIGTVTLRKIEPTMQIPQDGAQPVTIGGDIGIAIEANFGSPEITAALGLRPVTRFFINAATHAFKAIVVESGVSDMPPLVFISR